MQNARAALAVMVLALLTLTVLAYWPGLTGGFLFDDFSNIVREKTIQVEQIDLKSLAIAADGYAGPIGRPLATISFAVDHAIWGMDAWGFKLTNTLMHALNALLVFLLLRRLLPLSNAPARWGDWPAFVIAALWALHPLQVSSVLYVVQRMEMLSTTFLLIALWAYLGGRMRQMTGKRAWPWLLACVPLVGLGLLCKETAVLFPAFALALELTVLGFAANAPRTGRALKLAYLVAAATGLAAFLLVIVPHYATEDAYLIRDFSLAERLMTQLRVLPMYLGWIVLPQPASYVFYYDSYPFSRGLLEPATTLAGGLFLLSLLVAAWTLRRRLSMLSLGILWFFAAHLLTSNVVPLELVFEHRNYFAILGVLLALSELARRMPVGEIPRVRQLIALVLIVGFLGLTVIRTATWGNSLTLAMEFVAKNPNSSRASMDLGEHYLLLARNDPDSRLYKLGMQELERGSLVPDASLMPEQGLIVYATAAGQTALPEWWDRVVRKLEEKAIGPQEVGMIIDLLKMRNEGIEFDDARFADAYLVLVNRVNMPPSQYYFFGEHALEKLGDRPLALALFKRVVDKGTEEPDTIAAMISELTRDGHIDMAREVAAYANEVGVADIRVDVPAAPSADGAEDGG